MTAADPMTTAAGNLLAALPPGRHRDACCPFTAQARTEWSYLPGTRHGIALSVLGPAGRKAAHRLLGTALSRPAFAQAVTIMAFEEVLDLDEGGRRGRRSDGYHVAVFGSPGDGAWAWRFEGHHLSVNVTVIAGHPLAGPLFMGANPARVHHGGQAVIAPLLYEEDLARAIITGLPPALRDRAIVTGAAPDDIVSAAAVTAGSLEPVGITASMLPGQGKSQFAQLLGIYQGRLAPGLAGASHPEPAADQITFAWAGGLREGNACYYRIQAPGLLIEYCSSRQDPSHAHTVIRRPGADFGASAPAAG